MNMGDMADYIQEQWDYPDGFELFESQNEANERFERDCKALFQKTKKKKKPEVKHD